MKIIRLIIGTAGGYLLASLITVTLSLAVPFSTRVENVVLASMLGYIIWLCLILYSLSSVKLKNLIFQFTLISINFYLINTSLIWAKG